MTIANDGGPAVDGRACGMATRALTLSLRDAAGDPVPMDQQRLREREAHAVSMGRDRWTSVTYRAGRCRRRFYALDEWYHELAPGCYTLTVAYHVDAELTLASNPFTFAVVAAQAQQQ